MSKENGIRGMNPLKIITSLSPSRIARQQYCITTFLPQERSSTEEFTKSEERVIVCVQGPGEQEKLAAHFPGCEFVVGTTNTSFSKPTPKITELIKQAGVVNTPVYAANEQAGEPALIINSDISIESDISVWDPVPGTLKMGIRTDFNRRGGKRLQKWGIDAFLILPEMIELLSDIDFAVGCPGWDFWIPYVLCTKHGYQIEVVQAELLHEIHEQAWSKDDYEVYKHIMMNNYRVHDTSLGHFILDITGRVLL